MISEGSIREIVEGNIADTGKFIVEIKIKTGNKIEVLIDHRDGIGIKDCVALSRHIEGSLDREKEDFELVVSSAGIDQPFKVFGQYEKNVGRVVSILTNEGVLLSGELKSADKEGITIESKSAMAKEKGKGKQIIIENIKLSLNQIKETKLILSFK